MINNAELSTKREEQDVLFKKICKEYPFKHHQIDDRTFIKLSLYKEDDYRNHGGWSCFDEIFMGHFDDDKLEHRLIAFFHELGHVDDKQKKRLGNWRDWDYYNFDEASAWNTGIRLAKEHGITFSEDAINWGKEQLSTYFKKEKPNKFKKGKKYLPQAIKYAFKNKILWKVK